MASNTLVSLEEQVEAAARTWTNFPRKLAFGSGRVTVAHEVRDITGAESEVEIFAVVTAESARGVQRLGKYKLSELYFGAESPVMEFNEQIEDLYRVCMLAATERDELERNTKAADLWSGVTKLVPFLGKIGDDHDEAIAVLTRVCDFQKVRSVSQELLKAIASALETIRNRAFLDSQALDLFENELERGGADLGLPSS
jgi:hypothetical protein